MCCVPSPKTNPKLQAILHVKILPLLMRLRYSTKSRPCSLFISRFCSLGIALLLIEPCAGAQFEETGSLNTPRALHTATLLENGKVLVAAGSGVAGSLASAELYDPAAGTWTPTGNLAFARQEHTATLLENGQVFVTGGYYYYDGTVLAHSELYDPATGTWTRTDNLNGARYGHTAILLADGRVLVAGGKGRYSEALTWAEIYDPQTGTWTVTGDMAYPRVFHTATLLPEDKVLVAGDERSSRRQSELYDQAS